MGAGGTNIRVKKLARQLGKPLPEVIETLRQLGLERYAHPEAVLPGERLAAVQLALQAPEGEAEGDFGDMMASLGVRPLGEDGRTPSGRHRTPSGRHVRPTPTAPQRPPSQTQPIVPQTRPRPPASDRTADLQEALESVQASLARVTRDLNREVQSRQEAQRQVSALRQQLADRGGELAAAQVTVAGLQAELQGPAGGDAGLLAVLAVRGVQGPDAARRAVAALLQSRRFEAVISELAVPRRDRLATLLQDHLLLHCGRSDCPPPEGVAVLRVAEDRCEVCGGHGLTGLLEDFADTLLLNGWNRVALQGGRPQLLRLLEAHLDPRISLRFLGGGPLRDGQPPHVTVRWLPGDRAPTLVEGIVLCTDTTLGGMLKRATRHLRKT